MALIYIGRLEFIIVLGQIINIRNEVKNPYWLDNDSVGYKIIRYDQ